MHVSKSLRDELLAALPRLRAFARSLTGNIDTADDLVQETMTKAWAKFHSFEEGTNLDAWLFTILRNQFYSDLRKKKREVADASGSLSAQLAERPQQHGHLEMVDFKRALMELPEEQREALLLVGALGFPYEEAAEVCGVATGTVKSRVNRSRCKLAEVLGLEQTPHFGRDATAEAVFAALSQH